jgi:hypothetical protein
MLQFNVELTHKPTTESLWRKRVITFPFPSDAATSPPAVAVVFTDVASETESGCGSATALASLLEEPSNQSP